jgi:hypothetical protein
MPSDLKTMTNCAIYRHKRHRRKIKRLFKSILRQYQGAAAAFVPMCHVRNTVTLTPSGNGGINWEQNACFLFSLFKIYPLSKAYWSGGMKVLEPIRYSVVFLQHPHIHLIAWTNLRIHQSMPLPNSKTASGAN